MSDPQKAVLTVGVFEKTLVKAFEQNNTLLEARFKVTLKEALQQFRVDFKREMRDEVHSLIAASEKRVIKEITEFINSAILPQIDDLQTDMAKVKIHLKLA